MRLTIFLSLTIFGCAIVTDAYTASDLPNIGMFDINNIYFKPYLDCFLGKGHCPDQAKKLGDILPNIIATSCENCTPEQRDAARKLCLELINRMPDEWDQLVNKYDPDGINAEKLHQFLSENN